MYKEQGMAITVVIVLLSSSFRRKLILDRHLGLEQFTHDRKAKDQVDPKITLSRRRDYRAVEHL
jgi:hypothetical protein